MLTILIVLTITICFSCTKRANSTLYFNYKKCIGEKDDVSKEKTINNAFYVVNKQCISTLSTKYHISHYFNIDGNINYVLAFLQKIDKELCEDFELFDIDLKVKLILCPV